MIKSLSKVAIEGTYFNIRKAIFAANIILNREKLKTFFLRSGKWTEMSTFIIFNKLLEILAIANR